MQMNVIVVDLFYSDCLVDRLRLKHFLVHVTNQLTEKPVNTAAKQSSGRWCFQNLNFCCPFLNYEIQTLAFFALELIKSELLHIQLIYCQIHIIC